MLIQKAFYDYLDLFKTAKRYKSSNGISFLALNFCLLILVVTLITIAIHYSIPGTIFSVMVGIGLTITCIVMQDVIKDLLRETNTNKKITGVEPVIINDKVQVHSTPHVMNVNSPSVFPTQKPEQRANQGAEDITIERE